MYLLIFVLGLIIGSFTAAFTYRLPRSISITYGRSYCPKCKAQIAWYDNIPLLSYFLLKGKCRNCAKTISFRYPVIELSSGLIFVYFYYFLSLCGYPGLKNSIVCLWESRLSDLAFFYLIFLTVILISIFVVDFEHRLIPDQLVFAGIVLNMLVLIFIAPELIYGRFFAGFAAATFLLVLHIVTLGKGMGLGDVKLGILGGLILGPENTVVWLFLSFISGGLVGVIMIMFKKAKFGKQIAFGPFMVFGLLVSLIFGNNLFALLFPYL